MSMVDSVLLVVDAFDGPMPQTRFVTKKAFAYGLKPIVVINKVDRPGARPDWVVDQVFDLFVNLDATDEQLDFPIVYASALNGIAGLDHEDMAEDMTPLYQAIVDHVPAPDVDLDGPFQMQISQLDYNSARACFSDPRPVHFPHEDGESNGQAGAKTARRPKIR